MLEAEPGAQLEKSVESSVVLDISRIGEDAGHRECVWLHEMLSLAQANWVPDEQPATSESNVCIVVFQISKHIIAV